jgi:uncharacterized membrane protein
MDANTAPKTAASNDTVMAAVATIPVVGLIIYFAMKDAGDLVKFYAKQSIGLLLVSIALTVLSIILGIVIGMLPYEMALGLGIVTSCASLIVSFVPFILWIILLINALQGKKFRTPVMSDMLDQILK